METVQWHVATSMEGKYSVRLGVIPQRSESSKSITMGPLPSECWESKVRYQGLPWGIDTFHYCHHLRLLILSPLMKNGERLEQLANRVEHY